MVESLGMVHDIVQTGFAARMRVDLRDAAADDPLVEAGPLRLALRMAGRTPGLERYDRDAGNYLAFPMPDGSCPVVEATLAGLRVGIPLGLLARPGGVHDVAVRVAGSHFSIAVDGHIDDDMLSVPSLDADFDAPRTLSPRVASVSVSVPAGPDAGGRMPDAHPIARSIQYWTPDGHDAWVGDVAPGFFGGRLHLFYLFDRRHHGSKGGAGGHAFAHLSTPDLVHWDEHPDAVPVEQWWETVGTGTPFVLEGRLCLAYGLHTERLSKDPALPAGATYAVSEDGVRFRKTGRIVHPTRNPTIVNRPDGRLGLAAGYDGQSGLWTAPRPEGPRPQRHRRARLLGGLGRGGARALRRARRPDGRAVRRRPPHPRRLARLPRRGMVGRLARPARAGAVPGRHARYEVGAGDRAAVAARDVRRGAGAPAPRRIPARGRGRPGARLPA